MNSTISINLRFLRMCGLVLSAILLSATHSYVHAQCSNPAVSVSYTITPPSCKGGTNASVTIVVAGATAPYSYTILGSVIGIQAVSAQPSNTYVFTNLPEDPNFSIVVQARNLGGGPPTNAVCNIPNLSITAPAALAVSATITNANCNGSSDGAISLVTSGGTSPYNYLWSNGAMTSNISGLAAGTYSVHITDAHSCAKDSSFTVGQPSVMTITSTKTNVSCFGGNNGAVSITSVSGGTPGYTYLWNTGATTSSISGLVKGTYTVRITDSHSCFLDFSFAVGQPSVLNNKFVKTNVSCRGANDGSIDVTGTGGVAPYTYSWNTGATTKLITGLAPGTYTVTIKDAKGCTKVVAYKITQPALLKVTAVKTNLTCNGASNGSIALTATGGTAPRTFLWNTGATTATISGLTAGTYSVHITDKKGCFKDSSFTLTQPPAFVITSTQTNITCNGGNNGAVNITAVTNGTAPYTYSWSNGAATANISGLTAGTYSVHIVDANLCFKDTSYTITEPAALTVTATQSNVTCNGTNNGSITITSATGGTSPYSYTWSNGATTANISGLAAGAYSVHITDANLCFKDTSFTITTPNALTIAAAQTNVSCNGANNGSINVTSVTGGTSPYNYTWSNGATAANISGLAAGSYSVHITDANLCFKDSSFTITEPNALAITATQTNITCNGANDGSINITSLTGGTSPYNYTWSNGATTAAISGLAAGAYSVHITDANLCFKDSSFTITEPAVLAITASQTNITCNGANDGSINISSVTGGTSPYNYTWSNGATTAAISGLAAGTYSVHITDANLCFKDSSFTITEPAVLAIAASQTNITCNGANDGTINITSVTGGTSPYNYTWSNGATTANISGLAAGTYSVHITDANLCFKDSSFTITEPLAFALTVTQNNISCNGANDGSINITSVTGGTSPYNYSWSNGASSAVISGLSAGTYSVHVTDANLCFKDSSFTITEPLALALTTTQNNISCNGANDGSIDITAVANGTAPYAYTWSNGATSANISGLAAGTYSVHITDANLCFKDTSFTITEPLAFTLLASQTNITCNGANDGGVDINSVTGGTAPYNYLWSNGATSATLSSLAAGTYSVHITDANLCSKDTSFTITEPLPLAIAASQTNITCNGANDGTINITSVTGGTTPYNYTWSNGATTANIAGLAAGTYSVHIVDGNLCFKDSSFTITEPTAITIAATQTDITCNGANDGSINITSVTGGTSPYAYTWSNGATTASISALASGSYSVHITDANLCFKDSSFTIIEPPAITIAATQTDITCNGANDGSINITSVTGGTSPYSYTWSNGATTASISGLAAGSYSVHIADANLCFKDSSFTINEPAVISIAAGQTDVSCNGANDGSISITSVSGGTSPYSYTWSNSATTASISGLAPGSYSVHITDANLCFKDSSFTITEPNALTDSPVIVNTTTCSGSDGSIDPAVSGGTAPYTYAWSNAATTPTLTGLTAGTYTLTVTDNNGCSKTFSSYSISDPVTFTVDTTITHVLCNGGATGVIDLTITPSATYTISWLPGGQTTPLISGLSAGTYTVTIVDASNCTFTGSYTINQPGAIVDNPTVTDPSVCGGSDGAIDPAISGGVPAYTYAWSNSSTAATLSGLSAGTYTLQVTDANSCMANFSYSVADPGFTVTTSMTNVSCAGNDGALAITGTPGATPTVTYLWNTGATTASISNLTPGSYNVDVTDGNSCTVPVSFSLAPPTAIDTTAIVDDLKPTLCYHSLDGSASFSGISGGPYTYTVDTVTNNTAVFNNLGAGNYTLIITDGGGCNAFHSFTITEPGIIDYTINSTPPVCTDSNGVITFSSVTGGTMPYFYSIDGGVTYSKTQTSYTGLLPGTYNLMVKDTNQCSVGKPYDLVIKPGPMPYFRIVPPTCNGGNDGAIIIDSLSGGVFPFTFYINGQDRGSSKVFTDLSVGNYSFVIEDQECAYNINDYYLYDYTSLNYDTLIDSNFVYVPQPAPITASVLEVDTYNKQSTGAIVVYNFAGGTSPYQYSLDTTLGYTPITDTLISLTGLDKGYYKVFLLDTNQCTAELTVHVKVGFFIPNLITPNSDGQNDYFEIMGLPRNSTLSIYNSWNDRIYYDTNYNNSWEAKELSDGVYYYELSLPDGKHYKGWLQVLR